MAPTTAPGGQPRVPVDVDRPPALWYAPVTMKAITALRRRLGARPTLALAIAAGALLSTSAAAQWTKGGSLFTQDGIEISVDARVFAVFAMLNGVGYDGETIHGPPPLRLPQFSEGRQSARNRMGRPGAAVRSFDDVVKKHPGEPSTYVEAALRLGNAPRFEPPKGAPKLSVAMSPLLNSWFNEEGGAAIYRQVAGELTGEQKRLLDPLDALGQKLRAAARLGSDEDALLEEDVGPSGRVVVVLNQLDAHGALQRVAVGDVTYVVAGPRKDKAANDAVVDAAAVAFARTLVSRDVAKDAKAGTVADLFASLPAETKQAVGDAKGFTTELLACALVRAVKAGATCAGSPLEGNAALASAWPELDKRVKAYLADDSLLLTTAMPDLLAPLPAAPESAAAPGVQQATTKQ